MFLNIYWLKIIHIYSKKMATRLFRVGTECLRLRGWTPLAGGVVFKALFCPVTYIISRTGAAAPTAAQAAIAKSSTDCIRAY